MSAAMRGALPMILLVVMLMGVGQLLFKATALAWQSHGSVLAWPVAWRMGLALVVYGVTTLAWIWVLQRAPLTLAYPLVALTFVLVPLGAWWLFREPLSWRYMAGALLIVAGVALASTSRPG